MNKIKKFLKKLGPGFITGASDDDPSGIGTYSQTGAIFGYSQLWLSIFCFPFMTIVQEMCGRIGLVTGKGIAGVMKKHYSKPILFISVTLLLIANTINIGADLGAMASAGEMLFGLPFVFWLIIMTLITIMLEVFVPYKVYARFLKYLTLSLVAYVATVFVVKLNWSEIFLAFIVPNITFSKEYLLNIVAILGTTISPYLFFWQAGEEVEEEISEHKLRVMGQGVPSVSNEDIKVMRADTIFGMLFSQVVMFFIILTTASTLHSNGITRISTADQAAQALRPVAGDFAYLLFAAGIIGTGLLAVPVLAGSASYAISEAFGWKEGLYRKFDKAKGFYLIIILSTLVGVLVNFIGVKPFEMLYYTAVINGIIAPILLVIIILIANNQQIMGKFTNNLRSNIIGIITICVMMLASLLLIFTMIFK